jgi:glyoxylase-like metal-dependent hydrolase (beta-lactamase superfamily II)
VSEHVQCVLAPNPGPMTLDGTNTWVLAEPGSSTAVVVDPGPLDEGHLRAVLEVVEERGAQVVQTLLTHRHADHAEGATRFAELSGAPTRALGAGHDDLGDGDVVRAGGLEIRVVATPGHTADSLSFAVAADHALLTGDTVLGRGTTVVAHPDGELAAYLASLERLARLTGGGEVTTILPGHGPVVPDAAAMVQFYRRHRRERLEQVREALRDGAVTVEDVVQRVYVDVPREVWPAARLSVAAQLDYLRRHPRGGNGVSAPGA